MRRNKDGTIHAHSKTLQMQYAEAQAAGKVAPTQRDAWLSLTIAYLGDLDYLARQCHDAEALPVVTAKVALKLLVEFLGRNR